MAVEAYHRPSSLDDALDLTAEHESGLEIISGGTLTMPEINEGHAFPERVLDLRELGLDYVSEADGGVALGATTTLTQVMEEADVPLLREAAKHTGGWAVRNVGTVGGNLFSPPPLGDFAVALLALDAEVEIHGRDGARSLPLSEFYDDGGRALAPDELVTEIRVPAVDGETAYVKYTRSQEPAPPIVTVVANLVRDGDTVERARLALNGAGPHPVRMTDAEDALDGSSLDDDVIARAADLAAEAADPPEDALASAWYRRRMVREYVVRTLTRVATGEAVE